MEKAIFKTVAYYDVFDHPLKVWEIHKWLIGSKASLQLIEKKLKKLKSEQRVGNKGDYWFLSGRKSLIKGRIAREKISNDYLNNAKFVSTIFKLIPWIKLVGISGSLAMLGSTRKDDIDLFIITEKNRIWLSRFLLICLTSLLGIRRKRREKILSAAGKICINLILESDNLVQKKRNIYVAHEVLQMKLIWQKEDVYSKFLHDNEWAFKLLPNWKSGIIEKGEAKKVKGRVSAEKDFVDLLENLAKRLQLKIMNSPSGSERIENGALYFHPEDKGIKIMEEYKKKISNF